MTDMAEYRKPEIESEVGDAPRGRWRYLALAGLAASLAALGALRHLTRTQPPSDVGYWIRDVVMYVHLSRGEGDLTRRMSVRIWYRIETGDDFVQDFEETYEPVMGAEPVIWPGSHGASTPKQDGNASAYAVTINLAPRSTLSLMTGADYTYRFNHSEPQFAFSRADQPLKHDEAWVGYPNKFDEIDELTLILDSEANDISSVKGYDFNDGPPDTFGTPPRLIQPRSEDHVFVMRVRDIAQGHYLGLRWTEAR
ncbi:MAG TPA: hypothetical protein VFK02_02800 [Kofleriaceae bacterium]|nr:hypothetical protein [Kofleriaceae bacterium]